MFFCAKLCFLRAPTCFASGVKSNWVRSSQEYLRSFGGSYLDPFFSPEKSFESFYGVATLGLKKKKMTSRFQLNNHCGRLDVCKSGVYGAGLNRNMDEASAYVRMWNRRMYVCGKRLQKGSMVCGISVCTYAERDCRKEVHTESVVALSNIEGQTAGGTRERAGRVGVTKKGKNL